jgi:branched-subunit amino acid transport protein
VTPALSGTDLWLVIVVAGIGTFALRASFLLVFERAGRVPPRVRWVLSFVPAAVLAALVAPDLLSITDFSPARLLAGLGATVVAWYTENVFWTIVVGLVIVVSLRALF